MWQEPSALVINKRKLMGYGHEKGFRLDLLKMDVQGFQISISMAS